MTAKTRSTKLINDLEGLRNFRNMPRCPRAGALVELLALFKILF